MKIKIICVCGARPNFMKIAPIMRAFKEHGSFETLLVHTGQHYNENMSKLFLFGMIMVLLLGCYAVKAEDSHGFSVGITIIGDAGNTTIPNEQPVVVECWWDWLLNPLERLWEIIT